MVGSGRNRGKGFALAHGAAASKGDVLLLTDADLAYGTDALREACLLLRSDRPDLVCGSRRLQCGKRQGLSPHCASWRIAGGLPCFKRTALGLPMSDTQCGLKDREGRGGARAVCGLHRGRLCPAIWSFWRLPSKRGCRWAELPVQLRTHGASSVHLLRDSLAWRGRRCASAGV